MKEEDLTKGRKCDYLVGTAPVKPEICSLYTKIAFDKQTGFGLKVG